MPRNLYRDPQNNDVYEYDDDQVTAGLVRNGLVAMAGSEIDAHLNPVPAPLTRDEIEQLRLTAYADPVTGSDRYFAEAIRMQAMGGAQAEIDAAKAFGVARYDEIQALYPWPEDGLSPYSP